MAKFKKGDRVTRVGFSEGTVVKTEDSYVFEGDNVHVKWDSDPETIDDVNDAVNLTKVKKGKKSTGFETKDSGERQTFSTGMNRDVQEGKARYDLVYSPMLKRWAELMARGAEKYGERNWEKAATEEELNRFRASAFRHFMQWFDGETDEDHGAAVFFNISGAEMVKSKQNEK